jgi:methylmalonyl-CoA mutase C-terminal domain/subunit
VIRLLIGKLGLDGHDRGVRVVARALRDAGYEVVYSGLQQTPEQIAQTAIAEDVQGVGISILSGAHMVLLPQLLRELAARDATDIVVFAGGIIPDADIPELKQLGVREVFTPGTTLEAIRLWAAATFAHDTSAAAAPTPRYADVRQPAF